MHAVVGVTHAHFLLRGTVLRSDACCAVIDAAKPRVHVNNTPRLSVRDSKSGTFTCRSARTVRNLLSCSFGVISASPIIVRCDRPQTRWEQSRRVALHGSKARERRAGCESH